MDKLSWLASKAVILNDHKLLTLRMPGYLDLPGGRMKEKETPEKAVIREVKEELGIRSKPRSFLGTIVSSKRCNGFGLTFFVFLVDAEVDSVNTDLDYCWTPFRPGMIEEILGGNFVKISSD